MLKGLFDPSSIAVVGASKDPSKVGHAVLNNLIRFGFKGGILPVNPTATDVLGLKAYPSISNIDKNTDLAVIAIPAKFVPQALVECSECGIGTAVIISAGFKEAGPEGVRLEAEIRKIGSERGIRLLGPNCLGVINTANSMNATFSAGMLPPGRTAFFSQSGALGIAILDWAIGNKMGFSKFISLGNKTDLSEIDFIEYFIDDPETDIILGYIEDVVDGRRFLDIAKKATKVKPVILLKSGGTEAGARAASSHTGALAGSDVAFNAAFAKTGVIRAAGIEELFDTALAFKPGKIPEGKRLLILTNAGGPGIIAADMAERLRLELPHLSKESLEALMKVLPPTASLYNPIDIIGDATSARYASVLEKAVSEPSVDGIVVILTPQAMVDVENVADVVIKTSQGTPKPIITSFMGEARVRESVERLKASSITNYSYPEEAVKAFKRLADHRAWISLPDEKPAQLNVDREKTGTIIKALIKAGRLRAIEDDAMSVLASYGFNFPKRAIARTGKEAGLLAGEFGFPVVMKISSPDILHKTEVGGVKLGISSKKEAEDAFALITSNARRLMPSAFINGVMVYEMLKEGREVILGVTLDRTFGHMLMFGLGGIFVEALKDVSFRIVPVGKTDALEMISEIKTVNLLKGFRGEPPSDMEAIAQNIIRLSSFVEDFPEVMELDINPLLVRAQGAVCLDARIIFKG